MKSNQTISLCAVTLFVVALEMNSVAHVQSEDTADFHLRVARAALSDQNLDIALQELRKAQALSPSDASVAYVLGVVLSEKGQTDEALVTLKKAMALGLSDAQRKQAADLLATLTYKSLATAERRRVAEE